jgi:cytochrome c oxidase cbb3-type subunit 3
LPAAASIMVAWKDVLGSAGVEDTVAYVLSLSGSTLPAGNVAHGAELYAVNCVACHGERGQGNPLLGAPNLADQIWLHGGSADAVRATILDGRQNQMPAQLDRLGAVRVRLLAAYVLGLGEPAP